MGSWVRALLRRSGSVQGPVPVPGLAVAAEEPPFPGWPLPQLVSLFLPEFPVRPSARQQQLKVPSGDRCSAPGNPSASPGTPRVPRASRRVPSRPVPALLMSYRDFRASCSDPRAVGAFQRGLCPPYEVPVHPYSSLRSSHRIPFSSRLGPPCAPRVPHTAMSPSLVSPFSTPLRVPYCVPQGLYFHPPCPMPLTHPGGVYSSSFHSVYSSCPLPSSQILGLVAKGSFGTILKVLDCGREKVCAVKVGAAPWPGASMLSQGPPPPSS